MPRKAEVPGAGIPGTSPNYVAGFLQTSSLQAAYNTPLGQQGDIADASRV